MCKSFCVKNLRVLIPSTGRECLVSILCAQQGTQFSLRFFGCISQIAAASGAEEASRLTPLARWADRWLVGVENQAIKDSRSCLSRRLVSQLCKAALAANHPLLHFSDHIGKRKRLDRKSVV